MLSFISVSNLFLSLLFLFLVELCWENDLVLSNPPKPCQCKMRWELSCCFYWKSQQRVTAMACFLKYHVLAPQVQRRGGHVERPIFHDHILRSLTGSSVWPSPTTDFWLSPDEALRTLALALRNKLKKIETATWLAPAQSCLTCVREGLVLHFISESQIWWYKQGNSLLIRFFLEKHVECLLETCVTLSFSLCQCGVIEHQFKH